MHRFGLTRDGLFFSRGERCLHISRLRCCGPEHAHSLVTRIGSLPGAEVVWEPTLNQGLVRFLDANSNASEQDHDRRTDEVMAAILAKGEAFFGGTVWRGRRAMRVSVCCWQTSEEDVERVVEGAAAADSWATDGHKWLNVPYDCGYAFVANREAHRAAMSYQEVSTLPLVQFDIIARSSRQSATIHLRKCGQFIWSQATGASRYPSTLQFVQLFMIGRISMLPFVQFVTIGRNPREDPIKILCPPPLICSFAFRFAVFSPYLQ